MNLNPVYKAEILTRRLVPARVFQWRYQWVGAMPLVSGSANRSNPNVGLRLADTQGSDLPFLKSQAGPSVVMERVSQGHSAVIAEHKAAPVGVCWFTSHDYHDADTEVVFKLAPNEAWLYGSWVHRERRGEGIYRRMCEFLSSHLATHNIDRILFAVDASNHNSRLVHTRLGGQWIGHCWGAKLFNRGSYRCDLPTCDDQPDPR